MSDTDEVKTDQTAYEEAEERFDAQPAAVAAETEGVLDEEPAFTGDGGPEPEKAVPGSVAAAAPAATALPHPAADNGKGAGEAGYRRAAKVYDWLGFIGGVFAVALGITMLAMGTPEAIRFGADFHTEAFAAMTQIAFILKVGLFGVLVAMGLGLMGTFGPRLMAKDRADR